MTHQLSPHQARALRAAAAVTGRARRLGAPAALASALAMPLGACGHNDEPQPQPHWTININTHDNNTTSQDTPQTTSPMPPQRPAPQEPGTPADPTNPVEPDPNPDPADPAEPISPLDPNAPAPSCLNEQGLTDWRCCAEHVDSSPQALGCDLCPTPYEDEPSDCLSCWHLNVTEGEGLTSYNACCSMFVDDPQGSQQAGCSPWGPPAPPRMRGATIAALLGLPTSEVRHAAA